MKRLHFQCIDGFPVQRYGGLTADLIPGQVDSLKSIKPDHHQRQHRQQDRQQHDLAENPELCIQPGSKLWLR